jgi:muconolactone D-isomerase
VHYGSKHYAVLHAGAVEHRGQIDPRPGWDPEIEESAAAKAKFKILGMYKVAGQRRVIAIVEMPSADELDRAIFGRLPMREFLQFEAISPLRDFEDFLADCKTHFQASDSSDA